MNPFVRGLLDELKKNASVITGTSLVNPMQAKLRSVAAQGSEIYKTILGGRTSATKAPVK